MGIDGGSLAIFLICFSPLWIPLLLVCNIVSIPLTTSWGLTGRREKNFLLLNNTFTFFGLFFFIFGKLDDYSFLGFPGINPPFLILLSIFIVYLFYVYHFQLSHGLLRSQNPQQLQNNPIAPLITYISTHKRQFSQKEVIAELLRAGWTQTQIVEAWKLSK